MKVARGRSWQPEIGMEHASRGRRSGNKGVGARWRGRFRIFSARHCSRTEVSHAENSGMTTVFFSLGIAPVSGGVLTTGVVIRRRATTEWMARGGWFLFFFGGCSGVGGGFFHTLRSGPSAPSRRWRDATSINALCFKRFVRRKRRILRRRRALFRRTTRHPLRRRRPRM